MANEPVEPMTATERVEQMAWLAEQFKEADAAYEAEQAREQEAMKRLIERRDATLKDLENG